MGRGAKACLSTEDQQEVIELYKTGQYSYEKLANQFYVSKGTIINVVKQYPYNKDKKIVYSRLQQESKDNLDECITRENKKAQEACKRGNMLAYTMHLEHLKELYKFQTQDMIYEPLKQQRLICEQSAWDSFAQDDYINFAVAADMWELLTEIIGDMQKSPFKRVVQNSGARRLANSVRYSKIMKHVSFNPQNAVYSSVSKRSWNLIAPILPEHKPLRGKTYSGDKIYFEAIYFLISNTASFRVTAKKYKLNPAHLYTKFGQWYKAEVFKDCIELISVCPELQAIESKLISLERIRQEKGILPRIKDL